MRDYFGRHTDWYWRRFYELTDKGLELLRAEVARLAGDVRLARSIPGVVK